MSKSGNVKVMRSEDQLRSSAEGCRAQTSTSGKAGTAGNLIFDVNLSSGKIGGCTLRPEIDAAKCSIMIDGLDDWIHIVSVIGAARRTFHGDHSMDILRTIQE